MDQDNTTWTVARTPGVIRGTVCPVVHQRTASLDSERGTDEGSEVHAGRRQTVRRELNSQSTGRPRLKYRPSSRTGENPLSGMIGGTMETAASFEARFAPSSYPTGPLGQSGKDRSNRLLPAPRLPRLKKRIRAGKAGHKKAGKNPHAAKNSRPRERPRLISGLEAVLGKTRRTEF